MLEGAGQALWEKELPIGGGALEIPGLSLANLSRMPFKDYRAFSTELLQHEAPSFLASTVQQMLPGYEGRTLGQGQEARNVAAVTTRKIHMDDAVYKV